MRYGFIELGSNSVRLLIRDEHGDDLIRRSEHLHLAARVAVNGCLDHDDISLATQTAREFTRVAADHEVDQLDLVATEVFRIAGNGAEALDHISRAIYRPIRLLTGAEEATLSWRGATAALPGLPDCTVADLGGGSLALASGNGFDRNPVMTSSHRIGVSLLAPLAQDRDVLSSAARVRLEQHTIDELRPDITPHMQREVVLVGGWARALAQLVHTSRRGQVPDTVHGLSLDAADLGHIIARVSGLPAAARLALPGIKVRRAGYLPTAATVLRQVLRELDVETATVSTAGLRDGALAAMSRAHRGSTQSAA